MARKHERSGSGFFRGIASHLHIKNHTAGTSNEISLSVLDDLKNKTELKEEGRSVTARLGGVSLFTLSGKKGGLDAKRKSNASESSIGSPMSIKAGLSSAPSNAPSMPALPPLPAPSADRSSSETRAAKSEQRQQKKQEKAQAKESRAQRKQARKQEKLEAARSRALTNPEEEIRRRKKNRKMRKMAIVSVAAVFVIGACSVGLYAITEEMKAHQVNVALVEQGMSELEKADETILAMDSVVTGQVTESSIKEINALKKDVPTAEVHLNAAEAFAEEALVDMRESNDKDAAEQLKKSVKSRRSMMDEALKLMEADVSLRSAATSVEECWDLVLQADSLVKEAAALVEDTTVKNTRASQAKSEEALSLMSQASQKLNEAQKAYPGADFSALEAYINKRIESIGYAIASDEAIYLQDKQTADSQNALYNETDAEAVALAEKLPANPVKPLLVAFEKKTADTRKAYLEARSQAGESDSFIRDYVGEPSE